MNKYISYAYDFISYLGLQNEFNELGIKKIILFGSGARGEADEKSDIDLFVDTTQNTAKKFLLRTLEKFRLSDRIKKWKIHGVKNKINIISGNLDSEKFIELKKSMQDHAVVLWQKFEGKKAKNKLRPVFLVKWSTETRNPNKRVKLARFIYGYKQNNKSYPGFLRNTNSRQIGNSIILVNPDYINQLRSFFIKNKIRYIIKELFED
ncbi:nucleotidyltransferase domain-containing protein [Candidatus Woesearchaeota archaeon]|nr:nucleotidyltransferase domain-containing protein [Candidatus Woesearchaeota archaeon]